MKTRLLLASVAAIGLASVVAWAGVNVKQNDTGGICWEFTSGNTATDAWCWSSTGVLDFAPATTAADSAATNDSWEIALTTPVDTTGTNTHNALTIDMAIGNATGGTNAATGVQIDAITGDAQVTETGINIGSGWDSGITNASPLTQSDTADFTDVASADSGTTNDSVEIAFTSPVDTTGTNTHNALTIDLGIGNASGGTNVVAGLQIDAITGDAQVSTYGVNIGAMTGTGGTEYGIQIGSGWDAGLISSSDIELLVGNMIIGNGTPGETINGEDLYVEGISEFDGTANFDGAVDFDGTITIDSTLIAEEILKFPGRGRFTVCGDIATVNANTIYYGPSQAVIDSATAGMITCNTDAAGNATEATADEPALTATAIYPLGMVCYSTDMGATGSPMTFTLRSAGASYMSDTITLNIADNELSNAVSVVGTTAIASGATVAVAVSSAGDVGAGAFICQVEYAF